MKTRIIANGLNSYCESTMRMEFHIIERYSLVFCRESILSISNHSLKKYFTCLTLYFSINFNSKNLYTLFVILSLIEGSFIWYYKNYFVVLTYINICNVSHIVARLSCTSTIMTKSRIFVL